MKRFIAGAICPSCKKFDKIMMIKKDTTSSIECVSCGYTEAQPNPGSHNDKKNPDEPSINQ